MAKSKSNIDQEDEIPWVDEKKSWKQSVLGRRPPFT
jgi:hypothetical protein